MPTPKKIIADIMDRVVDRPGHNMLASEVIKKLDAGGYVIVPKEPTQAMLDAVCSDEPHAMIVAHNQPVRETYKEMIRYRP